MMIASILITGAPDWPGKVGVEVTGTAVVGEYVGVDDGSGEGALVGRSNPMCRMVKPATFGMRPFS